MNVGGIVKKAFPKATVISSVPFGTGCVNKTTLVRITNPDKELIIREYPQNGWKSEKEKYVYSLLRKKVPVPDVILQTSNYSVLSKVQGRELKKQDKELIKAAGRYLARIHKIKFDRFGWIVGKRIKPAYSSWKDFCDHDLKMKLKFMDKTVPKKTIDKINCYFEKNKSLLDIGVKPCLIHKDYHFSHILVDKKIKGIIDVEWAMSGHSELDISKSVLWMFYKDKKLEKLFLDGYRKEGKISPQFGKRRKLYDMLTIVSSLAFSCEMNNQRWFKFNLKRLGEII